MLPRFTGFAWVISTTGSRPVTLPRKPSFLFGATCRRLKNQSKISTWIFRIATNNCLRAIERSNRMVKTELPVNLPAVIEENTGGKTRLFVQLHCAIGRNRPDNYIVGFGRSAAGRNSSGSRREQWQHPRENSQDKRKTGQ